MFAYKKIPILALIFLCEFRAESLSLTMEPSTDSIHPGAPLALTLKIHADEAEREQINSVSLVSDDIKIRIIGAAGKAVTSRPLTTKCAYNEWRYWLSPILDGEGNASRPLTLNEWCSTELTPGKYKISCELKRVDVLKKGATSSETKDLTPPLVSECALTILQRDDKAVEAAYIQLLTQSRPSDLKRSSREKSQLAIALVVYAQSDLAQTAQFKLLNGDVPCDGSIVNLCELTDLATYLIEKDRPDIAKKFLEIFQHWDPKQKDVEPIFKDIPWRVALWAIHEMNKRGNAEISAMTQNIVAAFPDAQQPMPNPDLSPGFRVEIP